MSFALCAREFECFRSHGYSGPFAVYEPAEIRQALRRLGSSLADRQRAPYSVAAAGSIANYDRHLDIPFLAQHIRRPQIVDRVRSVLGNDLLCWRTEFFIKRPGDEGTDWHQSRNLAIGGGVAPLRATQIHPLFPEVSLTLSVWTAFTDCTRTNGCLQVIPGTHRELHYDESRRMAWRPDTINSLSKNGIKRGLFGYDAREIQLDASWSPDERRAVDLEMEAGSAVMFWEATMHGSLPNTSTDSIRMSVSARYVSTHVRIYENMPQLQEYGGTADLSRWHAVLVSGEDLYQFNRLEPVANGSAG